jgi:DNA adenine methylase
MNNLTLIRWAGGKGRQLNDLLPLIPTTGTYVEPFGGGGSVLLNRVRSGVEVYNDLDGALVNLFQMVRDRGPELYEYLRNVPYSRVEFERCLSFDSIGDSLRRAAAFYTVINQSISGKRLASRGDWARGRLDNLADRWYDRIENLPAIVERMRHVQIESRDALDILQEWDGPEVTFYCDPPYILDTRSKRKYYAVEPGDDYHHALVDVLCEVEGAVVLSGYNHPIYARLLDRGWWADTYGSLAVMQVVQQGGVKQQRVEIVFRNEKACRYAVARPIWDDGEGGLGVAKALTQG